MFPGLALGLVGDPHAGIEGALAHGLLCFPVAALADHHVAAVAVAPVEVAPAGGVLLDGGDYLEEVAPDRHERVLEPEHADAGVDEAGLDAENAAQIVDRGGEFACDQGDLA